MTNYEKLLEMTIEEICKADVLEIRCEVCEENQYGCPIGNGCRRNLERWLNDEYKEQTDDEL